MKPPDSQTREAEILSNDSRPSVGDVASFPIENGTFGAAGDPLTEGSPPDTVDGGRIGCIGGADCLGRWSLTR